MTNTPNDKEDIVTISGSDRFFIEKDSTGVMHHGTMTEIAAAAALEAGSGDVVGPASATDNAVVRFNSTTGKLVQNSGVTIDDSDNVTATSFVGDLTGNASGSAATVTGAAQTAITSVGTLTALQVDNININGNTISSTAGTDLNITPLAGQQIILDGVINVDAGIVTGATSITSTSFVGALTGNADTATALETARTIGGTSFDGTANIVPSLVTAANEAADTTCFVTFVTAATGDLQPKTNTGITFNSSTAILTATGFAGNITGDVTGNADTATTLETARAIYGNNFDGSAALTQIIASTYGGTGNGFTKFSGATSTEKTYTLPDANATIKYAGKETIWVPAAAMLPATTSGAAEAQLETSVNSVNYKVLDFDATADEYACFDIAFPKSWNEGTITFQVFWESTAADTDGVAWGLQGVFVSDNVTADTAYGTAIVVTDDAQSAAGELYVTSESSAVTISGTPAVDGICNFRIFRDVSDANDDMTEDARLRGVKIFFTTDTGNDD